MAKLKENGRNNRMTKKKKNTKALNTKAQKRKKLVTRGGMMVSVPGNLDEYQQRRSSNNKLSGAPMFAPYRGAESKNKNAMKLLEGSLVDSTSNISVSDSSFGKWMSKSDENIKIRKTNVKTKTSKTTKRQKRNPGGKQHQQHREIRRKRKMPKQRKHNPHRYGKVLWIFSPKQNE